MSLHDVLDRVTQSQQWVDGVSYGEPKAYTYNMSGSMIEQKYPSGRVVKIVLDNDGDLSIVRSKKNADSEYWDYAKGFSYTAAGAVGSMQLGNGRWESTVFNSRLQPTQIALGTVQSGTDKLKLNFTYNTTGQNDNNGNVLSQTITVPTIGAATGFTATQVYNYDSLNRIKDATETVTDVGQSWKQTFVYDRYGNRNPANNNRLSGTDGYLFDAAGNTRQDSQSRRFTYDGENKQTKVETLDTNDNPTATLGIYYYDGDGKRVKKLTATESTVFVYNAHGQLVAEYATQIAQPQDAKVSYLTNDHLGSARITTDANGQVISRRDFQPFGEEIARAGYGTDSVRQKFTGYERDGESALDFAQARYVATMLGRFNSADPVVISVARVYNPQIWNAFSYAGNNPLSFVDPNGLERIKLGESSEDVERERARLKAEKDRLIKDKDKTKDKAKRKELQGKIDAQNKLLNTNDIRLRGTRVVEKILDRLDSDGRRGNLQLSDFELTTDLDADFGGVYQGTALSDLHDAAAFVRGDTEIEKKAVGDRIFIPTQNAFYKSFGVGQDLVATFIGAGVVLHEDDHRKRQFVTGPRSENDAFREELKYLESVKHALVTRHVDFQRRIEEVRRAIKP